jgi:hypothetical protein
MLRVLSRQPGSAMSLKAASAPEKVPVQVDENPGDGCGVGLEYIAPELVVAAGDPGDVAESLAGEL